MDYKHDCYNALEQGPKTSGSEWKWCNGVTKVTATRRIARRQTFYLGKYVLIDSPPETTCAAERMATDLYSKLMSP